MTKQETIDKIISLGNRFHRFRVASMPEKYEFICYMDCPYCVEQEKKHAKGKYGLKASSSLYLTNRGNFLFKGLPNTECSCHEYIEVWFAIAESLPVIGPEIEKSKSSSKWKTPPQPVKQEVSKSAQVSEDDETMTDQELLHEFRKLCAEGKVNWKNINKFDKEFPHIGFNVFGKILGEEYEKRQEANSARFAELAK